MSPPFAFLFDLPLFYKTPCPKIVPPQRENKVFPFHVGRFWDTLSFILNTTKHKAKESEAAIMKGYSTESGYMGFVEGTYMLFACEDDYREYLEDSQL